MTAPKYVRPAPPNLGELAKTTERLRKSNERHAAKIGAEPASGKTKRPSFRPVALGDLAPALRRQNEARAARTAEQEMAENMAHEILHVCDAVAARNASRTLESDEVEQFVQVVRELCNALVASAPRARGDAIELMREAVESLKARMGREGAS
jgi:histone H3/H4